MARIVELHDTQPLVLRIADIRTGSVAVCRCGLSAAWPLCDGSHVKTRDEKPGALAAYTRDAEGDLQRKEARGVRPGEADPRA